MSTQYRTQYNPAESPNRLSLKLARYEAWLNSPEGRHSDVGILCQEIDRPSLWRRLRGVR